MIDRKYFAIDKKLINNTKAQIEKDFWESNYKYRSVTVDQKAKKNKRKIKTILDLEKSRLGNNLELVEEDYKENETTEMAPSP